MPTSAFRNLCLSLALLPLSATPVLAAAIVPAAPDAAAGPAATDSSDATGATPPAAAPPAASSALTITLGASGDFERKTVNYSCQGDAASLSVAYLNAAPNYLALIPVDGDTLLFSTVLSASGTRYVSGKYVWSTKGSGGNLYDLTEGANAKPILTCSLVDETP